MTASRVCYNGAATVNAAKVSISSREGIVPGIRFMTPELQGWEIRSEPIRMAASMRKTDPPDVTFSVVLSVRDIHTIRLP